MTVAAGTLMAESTAPRRYHPAVVVLHWLIALLVFLTAFLALGTGGEERARANFSIAGIPLIGIHMILGITVLVLLVVRLAIRLATRQPEWATAGNRLLDTIGVLTHWGLYIFTFAITITGLILALQTNRLSRIFSPAGSARAQFFQGQVQPGQFPPNGQPRSGQFPPVRQFQPGGTPGRDFGEGFRRGGFSLGAFHGLSWILLLLLIVLHVGAALYHQFLRRDGLLGRMWFGNRYA